MDNLFKAYDTFIAHFQPGYQGLVSLVLLAILVITLIHMVKKNWLWILLLILFVPAAIPILKTIGEGVVLFLKYIVGKL